MSAETLNEPMDYKLRCPANYNLNRKGTEIRDETTESESPVASVPRFQVEPSTCQINKLF